jgi:hemolysin activation/secretion protein
MPISNNSARRQGDSARARGAARGNHARCIAAVLLGFASIGEYARSAAPEAGPAPEQSFDINEFRVLGNTVLPALKIETAVYPFLGPKKTIHSVEQARDALVAVYRGAGFGTVLVDIPEQSVDDGVVRLKVTEGRIERVRIYGARYYSERRILSELPSLKPGTVPQLPQVQAELARLGSEARDRQITPILKSGTAPGTVAVDLNVHDTLPVTGSVESDNRYSADTAHVRVTGTLSYNNLFERNQSVSLAYQTAPADPSNVQLWTVNYSGLTWVPGWAWSVYWLRSDSNVAALGTLAVIGNGQMAGGRLTKTLDVSGGALQTLDFGVDYKDFGQNIALPGGVTATTPIHYVLWSGQYALTTSNANFDASSSAALHFSLRGVGGDDAEFEFKRADATASFAYLSANTTMTWRLWHGIALLGRLNGQYSEQPLVNNEQFSMGGVATVRGYLEAEELLDSAVAGTLELHAPPLAFRGTQAIFYLFHDRGIGMLEQPLGSEIESRTVRTDLYSWGGGFYWSGWHRLTVTFDWAEPEVNGSRTPAHQGRVDFSALYAF